MRSILIGFVLVLLCVLGVGGCRPRTSAVKVVAQPIVEAQPQQVQLPDAAPNPKKDAPKKSADIKEKAAPKLASNLWKVEVKGWGALEKPAGIDDDEAAATAQKQALAAAEKHATDNAVKLVGKYFHGLTPPIEWEPPADYVFKNFMRGKGEPRRCESDDNVVDGKKMECWSWTVAISPSQMEDARREDAHFALQMAVKARSIIAEARMMELGRGVAWAVLALFGVCGYIRLDDWSRGARRGWLRVALASLLCVGGVGWWLLS